jgi:GNAT superfamily N-acetyltransferase
VEDLAALIQQSAANTLADETFFRFWVGVAEEQVLALSIYIYHHQQRLGYLWYLATARDHRNQGIGSWMFTSTLEKIRQEALEPPVGLCWEVERPSDAPDPHKRQLSEQRIRFYEKNGSILIPNVDLLTPASSEGYPDVTYQLMYYPLQDEPAISSARIRSLVDFILLNGYGVSSTSIYYQQAIRSISSIPQ